MRCIPSLVVPVITAALLLNHQGHAFQSLSIFKRASHRTRQSASSTGESTDEQVATIVPPSGSFRDSVAGELSVTSLNILAPSYHWLGLDGNEKAKRIEQDRQSRVPLAIDLAKRTNADILCLQEVESEGSETYLNDLLAKPLENFAGYDSYLWSALHPSRKGDVVGLCVAWRSQKHNLISSECFRRGMMVQMEEVESGATFSVGNVHLPAKPSAIEGRLKAMSTTIKKIEGCQLPRRMSPLDGAAIIAGDFNCDHKSITAKLLETGYAPHGTIRDRNYKARLSKDAAFGMRHAFRFKDIYAKDNMRELAAPVTVSLSGRGPGCMDQIFFASSRTSGRQTAAAPAANRGRQMGRRKARRQKAIDKAAEAKIELPCPLRVDSVLATVDSDDELRTQTIVDGLPNVEAGFPTDHIPIGALFAPEPSYQEVAPMATEEAESWQDTKSGGVSANAKRRRESYTRSLMVRRRHNSILREVTEWLIARGARDALRDQPLFKWKWVKGVTKLNRKLRAPDLCCVVGDTLVIVEVTVAKKPDEMRRQKIEKYSDLEDLLRTSSSVQENRLSVAATFVVLMDEDGGVPEATRQDILKLATLSSTDNNRDATTDAKLFCNLLQRVFAEAMKTTNLFVNQNFLFVLLEALHVLSFLSHDIVD